MRSIKIYSANIALLGLWHIYRPSGFHNRPGVRHLVSIPRPVLSSQKECGAYPWTCQIAEKLIEAHPETQLPNIHPLSWYGWCCHYYPPGLLTVSALAESHSSTECLPGFICSGLLGQFDLALWQALPNTLLNLNFNSKWGRSTNGSILRHALPRPWPARHLQMLVHHWDVVTVLIDV